MNGPLKTRSGSKAHTHPNKTPDLPAPEQGLLMTAFAKSAFVAAAVAAAATLAPAAASAQSYGYGNGYNQGYSQSYNGRYYDRCETLGQGRTGAGALIGGGIGAVAGSQIASRGNRTGGSIIGGVLGAIVGSQVGRASNDQCRSDNGYAQSGQYYDNRDRYDDRANVADRYDDRGYRSDYRDARRYDNGYQVSPDGHYYFDPRRGWLPR